MTALKKPIPFGKYYLLERINVGGMAEVFKAKTFGVEGFERLLAVKRILPNIAEDEEFITMFIDEAKIAVQLQHANIAQIFDLGKVDDSFFIALEFVHGRDLRSIFDRMRSRGDSIPIPMACHITMQVCEGLDYAHNKRDGQGRELNLVHRDISPQNVLIGYEGEVKLIDFGIAKAAGKASKTQAGILKGKFGYMSPEQVRGLPIDRRSDIFAVGIVLYELLTGERLFIGESDFSTLEKVRNVEIMPPSSYNKKIPPELEKLVLKALARDPEDRYQNAIDLHDDLQSFLYSVGEFYSRKDLSAWMKKTFAIEIEEDSAKLEQYRQMAPPVAASNAEVSRRAAVGGGPPTGRPGGGMAGLRAAGPRRPKGKGGKGKAAKAKSDMGWDDEELDTQIFDKEDSDVKPLAADDLVLRGRGSDRRERAAARDARAGAAAGFPGHAQADPDHADARAERGDPATPAPARLARRPPLGKRKPTLVGMSAPSAPSWPTPGRSVLPPPPPSIPPPPPVPGRTSSPNIRRSGLNLPPAAQIPPARRTSPAFGSRPPPAPSSRRPRRSARGASPSAAPAPASRRGFYAGLMFLGLVVISGTGYWYYSTVSRPGRIRAFHGPGRRDRADRQRQGRGQVAVVDRPSAGALHAVGHARRLRPQRSERRAARPGSRWRWP